VAKIHKDCRATDRNLRLYKTSSQVNGFHFSISHDGHLCGTVNNKGYKVKRREYIVVAQFTHIISQIPFVTRNYNILGCDTALVYRGNMFSGHAIAQAVASRLRTMEAQVWDQVWSHGIRGEQSGTGAGFSFQQLLHTHLLSPTEAGAIGPIVAGVSSRLKSHPTL
jgi:hypothetical protein